VEITKYNSLVENKYFALQVQNQKKKIRKKALIRGLFYHFMYLGFISED